jgi:hypothetical protein
MHCEQRVSVAMGQREFGKPGTATSAVENRYRGTGKRTLDERSQCVCSELQTVCKLAITLDCKL